MGAGGGTLTRSAALDMGVTKVFTQHHECELRDPRSPAFQAIVARPGAL